MKKKKLERKLSLNKNTVADLNGAEMKEARGGGASADNSCFSFCDIRCLSNTICPWDCFPDEM